MKAYMTLVWQQILSLGIPLQVENRKHLVPQSSNKTTLWSPVARSWWLNGISHGASRLRSQSLNALCCRNWGQFSRCCCLVKLGGVRDLKKMHFIANSSDSWDVKKLCLKTLLYQQHLCCKIWLHQNLLVKHIHWLKQTRSFTTQIPK